jgi:uncharacterized surface protein with fasciclin (FAS1) repeats
MKAKLVAAAVVAAAVGVAPGPAPASDVASIFDTLATMKELTILYVGIKEAGEATTLSGKSDRGDDPRPAGAAPKKAEPELYTLFAPSDAAFKKLDDATIKTLATDKAAVKRFIRAHLVSGKRIADELKALNGKEIRPLQGGALKVEEVPDGLRIGGARIVTANIQCSNGVIHVIDTVLPVPKE